MDAKCKICGIDSCREDALCACPCHVTGSCQAIVGRELDLAKKTATIKLKNGSKITLAVNPDPKEQLHGNSTDLFWTPEMDTEPGGKRE